MTKNIFIDADVILDLLCRRQPFYRSAASLFTLADNGTVQLFSSPVIMANIFYILRKIMGVSKAREILRKLRVLVNIVPIDEKIVDLALNSNFTDFEDAIQFFAAREHRITTLLTRNIRDYKTRDILIQTPEEYLTSIM